MDEAQIQEKLKQNIPKPEFKESDGYGEQPEKVDPAEEATRGLPLDNLMLKQQMFDFLEIPIAARKSTDAQTAIDTILNWAYEQSGSKDFNDLLHVVGKYEAMLGSRRAPDRFFRLYKFVKINRQMDSLAEQMKALHG